MINLNLNPIIGDPNNYMTIQFQQTRETLMDTELYSHFIYSAENQFRRSRFYKDYKCNVMNKGLNFDQLMRGVSSDMTEIQLHHLMPTLNMAAIMICEHRLNTIGYVTTMDIIEDLEEEHRQNTLSIVMLTETNHQALHADPSAFISLSQAYGNSYLFLEKYRDGLTLDIAFKWMLQLKMEEQFGNKTTWLNCPRQREILLDWQEHAGPINY